MSPLPLRTARAGFTAIELMVSIAILAILIGVTAPLLRDFILNSRLTGQANDLMTGLMMARSEAVKRGVSVMLCGKQNKGDTECGKDPKWTGGWFVAIDADRDGKIDAGTVPLTTGEITGSNELENVPGVSSGPKGAITYAPTGIATSGASTMRICDSRDVGRLVTVSTTGRASVTKVDKDCSKAK
ncbi:MAG TPA: GspH/FimT family pseudopilin [Burkholderiales bacterium]|nr:GspH/FimT family pseudopilin [Burkholderiales bacterium]